MLFVILDKITNPEIISYIGKNHSQYLILEESTRKTKYKNVIRVTSEASLCKCSLEVISTYYKNTFVPKTIYLDTDCGMFKVKINVSSPKIQPVSENPFIDDIYSEDFKCEFEKAKDIAQIIRKLSL